MQQDFSKQVCMYPLNCNRILRDGVYDEKVPFRPIAAILIELYYTTLAQSASDSTAHEQLFSLVVKRYLFGQWLKNIVKKLTFQKGGV